ncbi:MAG: hypothetical protein DYG89_43535 [Caldilinea sp. CFX5]|nr:hypothetical protein [Caldilinea sp. CFX5]
MSVNPNYHSYLLRLWRDQPDDPWRAALQATTTGERINFAEVSQMFAFLLATLSAPPTVDPPTITAPRQDDYEL